jgi:hypothetical protein
MKIKIGEKNMMKSIVMKKMKKRKRGEIVNV